MCALPHPWQILDPDGPFPDGLMLTPERQISSVGGAVYHAIRKSSQGFRDFGEAYFSLVDAGSAKDWKRHSRMTLNLVVPLGAVAFMLGRDLETSPAQGLYCAVLGTSHYFRLTVGPGWFMTFAGLGPHQSIVMNIADFEHDDAESVRLPPGAGPALPDLSEVAFVAGLAP